MDSQWTLMFIYPFRPKDFWECMTSDLSRLTWSGRNQLDVDCGFGFHVVFLPATRHGWRRCRWRCCQHPGAVLMPGLEISADCMILLLEEILHQLRLVVSTVIHKVSYIPNGAEFLPSTVLHCMYSSWVFPQVSKMIGLQFAENTSCIFLISIAHRICHKNQQNM